MEQDDITPFAEQLLALWDTALIFAAGFLTPGWRQYQILIVIGIAIVALLLRGPAGRVLRDMVSRREGWPKWQLRVVVVLRNRMGLIVFAMLAWAVYLVMQQITWPSRSYFVGLAATITTVWIGISFATRFLHNPLIRRLARWGLWIYATLYLLELHDEAATFLDGLALDLGELRISVLALITALVVIGLLFAVARVVSQVTAANIRRNDEISPSMQVLAVKTIQIVLYTAAFFIGIKSVGIDLTGLAVLSGAIGVGLGFGLQKVVSNLVSGVIILLDKSIKPGDVISLGDTFGWINALGARYVSVVTRDGREYLIPNEDLITGQVVNWSHSDDFVRLDIYFGTSYNDDPHQVRALAIEAACTVDRVLTTPKPPVCHVVGFGDSSVDYILRFWIRDPTQGLTNIRGAVYLALWDSFQAHAISIPFPQREVRMLGTDGDQKAGFSP